MRDEVSAGRKIGHSGQHVNDIAAAQGLGTADADQGNLYELVVVRNRNAGSAVLRRWKVSAGCRTMKFELQNTTPPGRDGAMAWGHRKRG